MIHLINIQFTLISLINKKYKTKSLESMKLLSFLEKRCTHVYLLYINTFFAE